MAIYSNIRKVSPILYAVDISDGSEASTVYARKKSDITIWLKIHGFTAAA